MSEEVSGIPLSEFRDPIHVALTEYAEQADGLYSFDFYNAPKLGFVPGKLTARSQTDVMRLDEKVADLFVIAFAPRDGTGDDKTYTLDQLDMGQFPNDKKYIPRSKAATHSEAHLTIASKKIETSDDPRLFAGHLSIIGLVGRDNDLVSEVGYVGQGVQSFTTSLSHGIKRGYPTRPTTTLTTGYKYGLIDPVNSGERFGDPHAIVNRVEYAVQVAGFIAISPEMAPEHLELLRWLRAKEFQPYPS